MPRTPVNKTDAVVVQASDTGVTAPTNPPVNPAPDTFDEVLSAQADAEHDLSEVEKLRLQVEELTRLMLESRATPSVAAVKAEDELDDDEVLFHFIEDGMIVWGRTWYRGQEIRIKRDSPEWNETVVDGKSWIDLASNEQGQYQKWHKKYIAPGKWWGVAWDKIPVPVDAAENDRMYYENEITKAAQAEISRAGRIPAGWNRTA